MSHYGPSGRHPQSPDPYDPQSSHPDGYPPPEYTAGQPRQPGQPYGQPQQYGQGEPYGQGNPYGQPQQYGQPADPWRQQPSGWTDLTSPQQSYREAQQPYYDPHAAYYDPNASHQPAYPGGQPTDRPAGDHPPPPRRRRTGWIVALVAGLVLVVAGGVFVTLQWVGDSPAAPGTLAVTPTADPDGSPAPDEDEDDPQARLGFGAVAAEADDCLVNDGSDGEPQMRIVACDEAGDEPIYQVLARFDEQVAGDSDEELDLAAQQICADTDGYEYHYRFVAQDEDDSFVLCMVVP